MKLKCKPVTNSSSVSYVMWGITLENSELIENEKLMKIVRDSYEKQGYDMEQVIGEDIRASAILEGLDGHTSLGLASPYDDDFIYIGKCPFTMQDNQTLKEFKQDICDQLQEIGIDRTTGQLHKIQECYQDG